MSGLTAHVWQSWRSLRARELAGWLLIGLLFGVLDSSSLIYVLDQPGWPLALLGQLISPLVLVLVIALIWLPVDRSDAQHPARPWRLAAALLLGAGLALLLLQWLLQWLAWPDAMALMMKKEGKPPYDRWHWTGVLGDALFASLCAGLVVALHEMNRGQQALELAMQGSLQEQTVLKRKAMAARLATLQAQVDPQFLFDTLVGIEQDYARGAAGAALRMEQLIRHLRVALPRLRESGSSLEAEAELLESYLAVRLGPASPGLRRDWPAELGQLAVPPMVLLPLLQRALALSEGAPGPCELRAELNSPGWRVGLRFGRPGLCGDAAEIAGLQQRLQSTTDTQTRLACSSSADHTLFSLELHP
ncbi:histidine kinase [Paucibacter sediminis]|uniref:Histidine kinase n=1 Tax=Paucibacter sediminis TaxID=3019553 RepID=A0AA95NGL7_9BURK|nr:histidine kinase [Paucibacter sp. S2-9]WIT12617.1 histidine kinase [Paucibacter sp. S2-9]